MAVPIDRARLTTEKPNPRTRRLDCFSTLEVVDAINREDRLVADAVRRERRRIARAVEIIVERLRRGGRLFYVGAGTSGRLGVLDAAECPPTFGVPRTLVQGIIAGGARAVRRTVEGAEDDARDGAAQVERRRVNDKDVVVGIAACGLTPFVRGALRAARQRRAATVLLTCAPQVRAATPVDVVICPVVGPEVITGSTRMKAGTATKLVLNTLSTATMVRMGKVYGNLMVDLRATSEKLRDRAERIVAAMTGLSRVGARRALRRAGGRAKEALLMHFARMNLAEARRLLAACDGSLRRALRSSASAPGGASCAGDCSKIAYRKGKRS